jgi:hypothetical protein
MCVEMKKERALEFERAQSEEQHKKADDRIAELMNEAQHLQHALAGLLCALSRPALCCTY